MSNLSGRGTIDSGSTVSGCAGALGIQLMNATTITISRLRMFHSRPSRNVRTLSSGLPIAGPPRSADGGGDVVEQPRGQAAAHHAPHRPVVVVAEPHTDDRAVDA